MENPDEGQIPQTPVEFARLFAESFKDKKPELGELIAWFTRMAEASHAHGYEEGTQAPISFTFGITQTRDKVVFIRTGQLPDGQLGMVGQPVDITPMFFNALTQLYTFGERQPVYQNGVVQFYVELTRPLMETPVAADHLEPVPEFKPPERIKSNVLPFGLDKLKGESKDSDPTS